MIDAVAIVSGGMDSVTLLHYLIKRQDKHPLVLTFTYGQKHSREVDCARHQADLLGCAHEVVDLGLLARAFASSSLVSSELDVPAMAAVQGDPQPSTYVPNRNMIFLSIAAAWAETVGAGEVYYGAQRHDLYGYWDTTPDFLARINAVLGLNRQRRIAVLAPLVDHSKTDVLRLGLELGVNYAHTWSCYRGESAACGVCPTCAERLAAFAQVGIADPLPYR